MRKFLVYAIWAAGCFMAFVLAEQPVSFNFSVLEKILCEISARGCTLVLGFCLFKEYKKWSAE